MTQPTIPALPDYCWPIDHACIGEAEWIAEFDQDVRDRADALAAQSLHMLTGYRVGGCPVTLRPCRAGCSPRTYGTYPVAGGQWAGAPGGGLSPTVVAGRWYNLACGCGRPSGCGCTEVCEVVLPGEVGLIDAVWLDGVELDRDAWRVDSGRHLVRIDAGDCWPLCQDLAAPLNEPDTFGIIYTPGLPVDGLGAAAAGRLAVEFAKACSGGQCALPAGVTQITRLGVSMTITSGAFPGGRTGLPDVDAYITRYNPHALKSPSTVWSPDLHRPRTHG